MTCEMFFDIDLMAEYAYFFSDWGMAPLNHCGVAKYFCFQTSPSLQVCLHFQERTQVFIYRKRTIY